MPLPLVLGFARKRSRIPRPRVTSLSVDPSALSPTWWLKADALALADNDPVGTWTDSSGNGRTGNAAGAARPTFKTGIINGKPVVRFNGTSHFMSITSFSLAAVETLTLLAVFSATAGTGYMVVEFSSNIATSDGYYLYRDATNIVESAHHGTAGYSLFDTTATLTTTPKSVRALHDKAAATNEITVWINGSTAGSRPQNNNIATGSGFGTDTTFIGARNGTTLWFAGDIAELILVPRDLTAGEATGVEAYFRAKYALY